MYEVAGADTANPLDVVGSVNLHSGTGSMVSATVTPLAGDFVVATGTGGPYPNGASAPFTLDYSMNIPSAGGGGGGGASVHDVVTNGSSIYAVMTEGAGYNNGYGSLIAGFKAASTPVTLTSSQNPSLFGGAVTFTATVAPPFSGWAIPTGTVTFMDGTTALGTATLNGFGVAYFGTAALTVGTHSITAIYSGNSTYNASTSSALSQNNTGPNTITISNAGFESPAQNNGGSTTVTSWTVTGSSGYVGAYAPVNTQYNPLPAADGSNLAFIYGYSTGKSIYQNLTSFSMVAGQHYVLTGVLGQRADQSHMTGPVYAQLINVTGSSVLGSASLPIPPLAGSGYLTNWAMSCVAASSGTITLQVVLTNGGAYEADFDNIALYSGLGSTTTLASSQNPSLVGGAVTFTATVTGSGGTPTGTVVFLDGTNALGSGTLNGSGVANFSTTALSLAATNSPHSITAVYGGDSTFCGSGSSALPQAVTGPTAIPIANGGFESPAESQGASGGTPTSWTLSANYVHLIRLQVFIQGSSTTCCPHLPAVITCVNYMMAGRFPRL